MQLTGYLSMALQVPVVDNTNLKAEYGIDLQYTRDVEAQTDASAPPGILAAVEDQLGLKLVKKKLTVQLFIMDRVERPAEN